LSDQTDPPGSDGSDSAAKPSTMQGNEFLYGHLVAGVVIAVAVANLVIRHGKGAPKHPQTGLMVAGLIASIAVVPILRTRNRFIAPFAALLAAFIVTLPTGPQSVRGLHALVIVFPLIYAFLLTQRQRKAALAQVKAGRAARPASEPRRRRSRRAKQSEEEAASKAPQRNRRYTPPKAKRAKR